MYTLCQETQLLRIAGIGLVGQDVAQARPLLDVNFQLVACFLQLKQREQNMFRVDC